MKFSANLGFLWSELSLPNAIRAAHSSGFDAVECHWPYAESVEDVRAALTETGLPMLGLNTTRGDVSNGENGLLAVPDRATDARQAIDEAFAYADALNCKSVHLMAGNAEGAGARQTFLSNLKYAVQKAAQDVTLLIEPLNPFDAPGYFLGKTDQAARIIAEVAAPNLKLMFDCYHVARAEGDVLGKLDEHADIIGHIQFAGVPDRGRPDVGTLNYGDVFAAITDMGWHRPLGAEYKPSGPTEPTLGWMTAF